MLPAEGTPERVLAVRVVGAECLGKCTRVRTEAACSASVDLGRHDLEDRPQAADDAADRVEAKRDRAQELRLEHHRSWHEDIPPDPSKRHPRYRGVFHAADGPAAGAGDVSARSLLAGGQVQILALAYRSLTPNPTRTSQCTSYLPSILIQT